MKVSVGVIILFTCWSTAWAGFVPVGVQQSVSLSTVTDTWGWTQIYQGDYSDTLTVANMFGDHKDYVMLDQLRY